LVTRSVIGCSQGAERTDRRWEIGGLTPVAMNPDVTVATPDPVGSDPDCAVVRPHYPRTANPDPCAIPGPVTRRPHVSRSGGHRHDFDLGCRGCVRGDRRRRHRSGHASGVRRRHRGGGRSRDRSRSGSRAGRRLVWGLGLITVNRLGGVCSRCGRISRRRGVSLLFGAASAEGGQPRNGQEGQ